MRLAEPFCSGGDVQGSVHQARSHRPLDGSAIATCNETRRGLVSRLQQQSQLQNVACCESAIYLKLSCVIECARDFRYEAFQAQLRLSRAPPSQPNFGQLHLACAL